MIIMSLPMTEGKFTNLNDQNSEPMIHPLEDKKSTFNPAAIILFVGVLLLGSATGYLLSKGVSAKMSSSQTATGTNAAISKGTTVGSSDTATFKDMATGVLQVGGVSGEGQYHLVRPGGDSQNVYLTSSIVDLSQFIGKKVTVHGQTQAAKVAGWLMDVGQVTVE